MGALPTHGRLALIVVDPESSPRVARHSIGWVPPRSIVER